MDRYLTPYIKADLEHKMVFLGGPRQVGKTTVAHTLLDDRQGYLNWDIPKDRTTILKRAIPDTPLVVYDELHKYRRWRNYLKGIFDEFHPNKKFLVTGSARLDLYRYGGDSLQGRYYYLRLHPLSYKEIGGMGIADVESLLKFGGFPEPFLKGSEARARRWSEEYRVRLVREDIATLEDVKELDSLEHLLVALPDRVGSPLSVNSLREDLERNHQTVARWLNILERTYAIFRLSPFGAPQLRAVKKEQKHYHFDWTLVDDQGAKFENLVACHLLKWCHFQFDTAGRVLELKYFRDHDKREVDFVVVEKKKPILLVEAKLTESGVAPSLSYLKARFPKAEALQVCLAGAKEFISKDGIKVWSAARFLDTLI